MRNIWRINREQSDHPKRNNFDLSFVSHSTFKFGYLYPVFKRKIYPGDSFQIDAGFDLKMMPVEFPVQSRMRAHMHFFYVKNKNLWKNWEDWIDGLRSNQECPHPYLALDDKDVKTGSIYDFMNMPTTIVGDQVSAPLSVSSARVQGSKVYAYSARAAVPTAGQSMQIFDSFTQELMEQNITSFVFDLAPYDFGEQSFLEIKEPWSNLRDYTYGQAYLIVRSKERTASGQSDVYAVSSPFTFGFNFTPDAFSVLRAVLDADPENRVMSIYFSLDPHDESHYLTFNDLYVDNDESSFVIYHFGSVGFEQYSSYASTYGADVFSRQILQDALPYRAYEAIYRSFYANDVLQPLIKNGRKEYNKFVTTDEDGADSTPYHLFRRNYEYDFLTSALPSPQAGPAPLVGMSALGEITVTDENGITTAQAVVDESTGKITDVTVTSPLASIEHGRTLMRMADVGMSINDFRNVNALTRLKERILRSGYRYKPFKKAIWGVDSSDDVLGMPEFIGGFSRDINISPIYSQANTAPEGGSNLGDWAGVGRVVGGSEHSVSKFFDDYGWVIGIMSITPVPAYSQLLPKENICPTNYLDYYFPDMAQLGMQPIPYAEVAPLQSYMDSLSDPSKKLTDAFGYQRPNYDMVGSVDEVHGEFRSTLRNMVINRIFAKRPELGSEFLEVNPSEINDIFIDTNPDDDVFIGHLAFRIYPKRPAPRVHIPGLGF